MSDFYLTVLQTRFFHHRVAQPSVSSVANHAKSYYQTEVLCLTNFNLLGPKIQMI